MRPSPARKPGDVIVLQLLGGSRFREQALEPIPNALRPLWLWKKVPTDEQTTKTNQRREKKTRHLKIPYVKMWGAFSVARRSSPKPHHVTLLGEPWKEHCHLRQLLDRRGDQPVISNGHFAAFDPSSPPSETQSVSDKAGDQPGRAIGRRPSTVSHDCAFGGGGGIAATSRLHIFRYQRLPCIYTIHPVGNQSLFLGQNHPHIQSTL